MALGKELLEHILHGPISKAYRIIEKVAAHCPGPLIATSSELSILYMRNYIHIL